MKLERLRLRNFRCYKDEISVAFDDITALIGKNDAGKSTIMDALDIFLNDSLPDSDDGCKNGDLKDITIICEFTDFPATVIIDEDYPTSLSAEYLLNPTGYLEIHKKYNGSLAKPKLIGVFANANHPTHQKLIDLLQLKNADLKKRAKELNVDVANIDLKINAQIRKSIRDSIGDKNLTPTLLPLNDDNAKAVWEGLCKYIPAFALFKSDRSSTDQDPEAQDPLKAAIKQAIKEKQQELDAITAFVETEVKKIASATLSKLKEMDPDLANELNPQFTPPKWDTLFKASITGDEGIPINKRGSGVKRLILLNFFRAKAEQQARDTRRSTVIYGIEEPETSQHPNNQRMLLRALSDLSAESQVLISTHTPMLARGLPDCNLRYIEVQKNKVRRILCGGADTNELFAKSLGVLPDNTVKLFIGVEGKHDICFLQNISKSLRKSGCDVPDLEKMELEGELIFFPLGGSTLALWTSRLKNLNRPEFHLFDRDNPPPAKPKYSQQAFEVNSRENCKAKCTLKKELENYLHKDAILKAYQKHNITIPINRNFDSFSDVPVEVAKLVHSVSLSPHTWDELDDEKKVEKERRVKHMLNSTASQFMTKQLLSEVDPDGDLLSWFEDIKELAEKSF